MIDDADDRVTVLRDNIRTARKEHTCHECFRTIRAGESYRNESYTFDGTAVTHKTCRHCDVVRDWLNGECGGFLYGGIEEDIQEHAESGYYPVQIKLMAVGMSRNWTTKRGALWRIPKLPQATP